MEELCQSCAMFLREDGLKGTNFDGSLNDEYCIYCFTEGKFTTNLSLEDYIEKQVSIAVQMSNISEHKARHMVNSLIPTLKRWKK